MVRSLGAIGVDQDSICVAVATMTGRATMSRPTLRKHFGLELLQGRAEAHMKVAAALFKLALDGNLTAQIFWLKCRCGWRVPPSTAVVVDRPAAVPAVIIYSPAASAVVAPEAMETTP